jgi:tRNA (cytidine/uridine-2'-O-)-methyltransferase
MELGDLGSRTDPVRTESKSAPGGMFRVVLYCPEIPQNTGNVARTCAATHTPLHLIEPLGFFLTDRYLRRAGLDYWPHVELTVHPNLQSLHQRLPASRFVYFSTHGEQIYIDYEFRSGDCLVFGSETRGLPRELLAANRERVLRLPMDQHCVRSLNLATTVGVALFEAMRQLAQG